MPPGWDGVETIARLWEVDPALQIVVCTAYSDYSWEKMTVQTRRQRQPRHPQKTLRQHRGPPARPRADTKKWHVTAQASASTSPRSNRKVKPSARTRTRSQQHRAAPLRGALRESVSRQPDSRSSIQSLHQQALHRCERRLRIAMTGFSSASELIDRTPLELRTSASITKSASLSQIRDHKPVRDIEAHDQHEIRRTAHRARHRSSA